jgi:uncharacterized protein (TIGR01777 family)
MRGKPMRVVINGATGLIARALCKELVSSYEVIALSRNPKKAQAVLGPNIKVVKWNAGTAGHWVEQVDGAFAVVNLAGENIAGRWTRAKMQRILESRLNAAKAIVDAIVSVKNKPAVLVQASATGFYGSRGNAEIDENAGKGTGFLADVCEKWEQTAKPVEAVETRLVIVRSGMVLSRDGGALPRMIRPFKFFLGGCPGNGKQWVSLISIDDEVAAIRFLIENKQLSGVFNLTTPAPITMKDLCRLIAKVLKRPCRLKIPAIVLRLIAGKMADEVLLCSQRVLPNRLLKAGFKFTRPEIGEILEGTF